MTPYFLRELGAPDISQLNCWRNDPDLIASLVAPFRYIGVEVDRDWYGQYLANRSTAVRLAICHAESNSLVGAVYLTGIDWITRSAELGIWIGVQHHRGKGAGEFACRHLLRHAFGDLNLNRVYLHVVAGNTAAHSLYRKLGFVDEGRLVEAAFKNGRYVDLVPMAILGRNFPDSTQPAADAAEGEPVG
jgi:diamine N-acetyltransferase